MPRRGGDEGQKVRHGREGFQPAKSLTPAEKELKAKMETDFRLFWEECLCREERDRRTGARKRQALGAVHDLLIDFLRLNELRAQGHAHFPGLSEALPERSENGDWRERWLYWRTLSAPPEVQDGPDGKITDMFYGRFWQGVVVRIKGDGLTQCLLMPRGHLKSTLATKGFTLWNICREPSERHVIRTADPDLAKRFVSDTKMQFEANEQIRKFWGGLVPGKRAMEWTANAIQVRSAERRGSDPTLQAKTILTEITGVHCDDWTMDDVVGERAFKSQADKTRVRMNAANMESVRDPGGTGRNIGTRWAYDDVHGEFVSRESTTCFLVATALDGDEAVPQSKHLTPLAYGKPLWPEVFTQRVIEAKRRGIDDDRFWFGQYFNQFAGTAARPFRAEWIQRYEGTAHNKAVTDKLRIIIGIDTASGLEEKRKGDLDYTAAWVFGQSWPDRQRLYLLGGLHEKLPASVMAKALVDLCVAWRDVARSYGSENFTVGVEYNAYTTFIGPVLELEQRVRGIGSLFSILPIKCDSRSKPERIRRLCQPYSMGRIYWPTGGIVVTPHAGGEAYDLCAVASQQMLNYPDVPHEDLLDAQARCYELAVPENFMSLEEAERATGSRDDRRTVPQDQAGQSIVERFAAAEVAPWQR